MVYPPPPPSSNYDQFPPRDYPHGQHPHHHFEDVKPSFVDGWSPNSHLHRPQDRLYPSPYNQTALQRGYASDGAVESGGGSGGSHSLRDSREALDLSSNSGGVHGSVTTTARSTLARKKRAAAHRRPSDAEEVEAGLALAGLGLALGSGPASNNNSNGVKTHPGSDSGASGSGALGGVINATLPPASSKRAKRDDKSAGKESAGKDTRKSCSECRRLKAKCDRVFPCSNCRRRGCAVVCPDGDLSCMQGKRLVLASTEQLHERIAQLETALFQVNSKVSVAPHPLLAAQYLDGGFASADPSPTLGRNGQSELPSHQTLEPPLEIERSSSRDHSSATSFTLATPRLSGSHRMAVESLLLNDDTVAPERREDEYVGENGAPAMIVGNARAPTPDMIDDRHAVALRLRKILTVLPPREELRKRTEKYWIECIWYQNILKREEFDTIYEPAVYAPTPANPLSPHKLACVLMVLVLDSFFDLSQATEDPAVADYWDAVQQCFDTRFGWAASVAGVQALALMTLFVGFGWKGARASNFYWLRQMTSALQQLGLHREPHPSMPEDEREFRRRVFHEAFTIDCLISINHGQRTAIPLENIETNYPRNAHTLALLKYEYMRKVKYSVIDIGLRPDSAPATPEQLKAVEQEMSNFDVSVVPEFHCPVMRGLPMPEPRKDLTTVDPIPLMMTTTSMCLYKSSLFLYRPSLRRIVARLRANPHESSLSDSDRQAISTTFNTCRAIVMTAKYFARSQPRLAGRTWSTWVQAFSAAVSITALAIWCGPHLEPTFISSAFAELSEVCAMISESGSERSRGVLALLPVLQSLVSSRYPHVVGEDPAKARINTEGEDMLFALLGGAVDQRNPSLSPEAIAAVLPARKSQTRTPLHSIKQEPMSSAPAPSMANMNPTMLWKSPATQFHDQAQQVQAQALDDAQAATRNGLGNVVQNLPSQTFPPYLVDSYDLPLSLSLVNPHPSSAPYAVASYPIPQNLTYPHLDGGMGDNGGAGGGNGAVAPNLLDAQNSMSATEIWARLQTFYEPTVWWGTDEGFDVSFGGNGMPMQPLNGVGNVGGGPMLVSSDLNQMYPARAPTGML